MKRIQASCFAILLGWTCLVSPSLLKGATHRAVPCLSATASLSSRGTKPGSPVELLVTVRHALHPEITSVERPPSFKMHALRKPQLLSTEEGDIWIFRYRMIPGEIGDFEIPPIIVTDGVSSVNTVPLTLRVSLKGEPPVLTAGELSRGVNLPPALGEEVLKNAPQPPPKLDPSPTPLDTRPFGNRAASTCWKVLNDFWNYPGAK